MVYFDEDLAIDTNTISGILSIELLKAQFNGENMEEVSADVANVTDGYADEDTASRGVYKYSTNRWKNGKIYYVWGSISSTVMSAVYSAILDWERKVSEIDFIDKTHDGWHKFWAPIGLTSYVQMNSTANLPGKNGEAGLGSSGVAFSRSGVSYCTIKEGLSAAAERRTTRHELGHVLGLNHEHQRWDRDAYLSFDQPLPNDSVNYGIINRSELYPHFYTWYTYEYTTKYTYQTTAYTTYELVTTFVTQYITYPIGTGSYTFSYQIPTYTMVPVTKYITTAVPYTEVNAVPHTEISIRIRDAAGGTATFDYKSVMLYSYSNDFRARAKKAEQGLAIGTAIPYNTDISDGDIETVKKMY